MADNNIPEKQMQVSGYKVVKWFDKKTLKVFYGVDAKVNGKWLHCSEDDKPLFFDTERGAAAQIKKFCKEDGVL